MPERDCYRKSSYLFSEREQNVIKKNNNKGHRYWIINDIPAAPAAWMSWFSPNTSSFTVYSDQVQSVRISQTTGASFAFKISVIKMHNAHLYFHCSQAINCTVTHVKGQCNIENVSAKQQQTNKIPLPVWHKLIVGNLRKWKQWLSEMWRMTLCFAFYNMLGRWHGQNSTDADHVLHL